MSTGDIKVVELFAGVGGFRIGLESEPSGLNKSQFRVIFSNQWEPGMKKQWASEIYVNQFGQEGHFNEDIHEIADKENAISETIQQRIPDHDLLVGGFPCQDYSVARTKSGELGIQGEKGKLWIPIRNIIRYKTPKPKIILLENVPRLLNSPANARGLNFSIILNDLISMGYEVEWRVINAAEYGMPQQRKRVFIIAYLKEGLNSIKKLPKKTEEGMSKWIIGDKKGEGGPFAVAFPVKPDFIYKPLNISLNLESFSSKKSLFRNAGYAWEGGFCTTNLYSDYNGKKMVLGDILEKDFKEDYIIEKERMKEWIYAKGKKNEFRLRKRDRDKIDTILLELYDSCMKAPYEERSYVWKKNRQKFIDAVGKDGFYKYDEGTIKFDSFDSPSRTIITAEIGKTPSRMRHIIEIEDDKFRRLMPVELERLNGFPDDWTKIEGITDSRRGFLMGNALVVGIVQRLKNPIAEIISESREK